MSALVEIAEFVASVLRLELDTPVRGFDGKELGTSNQQAQALANRTLWLKEKIVAIEKILEELKDPDEIMTQHLLADDPHEQYLTTQRGKDVFVEKTTANKPNGYLQLDKNGLLPSGIAKLYEARYLIVKGEEERLAVEASKNITICLQTSDNIVYYLNPNADPSVPENWEKGESTEIDRVVTVFGRLGAIVAEYGDYNTGLIEETEERLFVSPEEKSAWSNKQNELISGKNIGTVFGKSLLGGDNITLKDVENMSKLISELFKGANGIEISLDETGTIIVKGDSEKLPALTIQNVRNAIAGKKYNYPLLQEFNHDYFAWASKEKVLSTERTETVKIESNDGDLVLSSLPENDSAGYFPAGTATSYELKQTDSSFEKYVTANIELPSASEDNVGLMMVTIEKNTNTLVPTFTKETGNDGPDGFVAFSSKVYPNFYPWKAFQAPMTETEQKRIWHEEYWSDNQIWRSRREEVYLGLKSETPMKVSGYGFQNFEAYYWASTSTEPTEWKIQGRNSDSESWVDVDHQVDKRIKIPGDGWTTFQLAEEVSYKQLRILVLDVLLPGARASIPRLQFYGDDAVIGKDKTGQYFSFDKEGKVILLEPGDQSLFSSKGFGGSDTPIDIRSLKENFPIQLCGLNKGKIDVKFYATPTAAALAKGIISNDKSIGLKSITINDYHSPDDKANLKLAVSVDGKSFFSLEEGKWVSIDSVGADQAGGKLLSLYGFSPDLLETITPDQWSDLVDDDEEATLIIASGKEITNISDLPYLKSITLSFDEVIVWERMSLDKVKISLSKKYLSFRPDEEGTYKFGYRFM